MKTIQILRLTLDNFKGCRHLELDLDGRDLTVYGANATGKTTLYDALMWLLFGKDSHGRGAFDLKPLDKTGDVLDHAAITIVEALFLVDQDEIALRRTYYEQWSTKRGSSIETFDGNSSDFYVDGVPVKKFEFDKAVSDMVDEELFRTLTDVRWFCQGLDWRKRRSILFELAQVEDDTRLLACNPRFAPLVEAMGRLDLDDFRRKLQAERKALVGVRNDGPVRLDECQKAAEELWSIDFKGLEKDLSRLTKQRDKLSDDLLQLGHNALLDGKRNEQKELLNRMDALELQQRSFQMEQTAKRPNVDALKGALRQAKRDFLRATETRRKHLDKAAQYEEEIESCRQQWKTLNATEFHGGVCSVCGQVLQGAALEEAKESFRRNTDAGLADLVRRSDALKRQATEERSAAEQAGQEAADLESSIAKQTAELEQARIEAGAPVEDLPGYAEQKASLRQKLDQVDAEVETLNADSAALRAQLQSKLNYLDKQIKKLNDACAKKSVLTFTLKRMEDLRAELAESAKRLEKLDQLLFLYEDFIRYKTGRIEERINEKFGVVQWKLFDEQVNGGVAECCEATVDGVPYPSLNTGMQINAGIDTISALSEHYGVRVPLVVDNAERVTDLLRGPAQMIRLVVSAFDTEMRFEYGA